MDGTNPCVHARIMDRLPYPIAQAVALCAGCFAVIAMSMLANAQFKVVGPPPYSPTVARQKIRTLLEAVDAANRAETVRTLTGLLAWYRDLIDEELIAAWQKDSRANLTELMEPLADSRVAMAVVEFSWRQERPGAFTPAYAPMFVNLMTRFPESAQPFLDDLLGTTPTGRQTPDLSQPEAETVCRILLDMPDVGTWKKSALAILPHYRRVADTLLAQDLHGSDQEKSYRAERWLADLRSDGKQGLANEQQSPRRRLPPPRSTVAVNDSTPTGDQKPTIVRSRASDGQPSSSVAANSNPTRPSLQTSPPARSAPPPYTGAKSGTLECAGRPIPQNAEYVFRNVPLVKMQLDYDTKTWDARLVPGDGQTQTLIVRNKSSGPQKHCTVHWSVTQ
jgi:hypothetical protein